MVLLVMVTSKMVACGTGMDVGRWPTVLVVAGCYSAASPEKMTEMLAWWWGCWHGGGDAGDYEEGCGGRSWWLELLIERERERHVAAGFF